MRIGWKERAVVADRLSFTFSGAVLVTMLHASAWLFLKPQPSSAARPSSAANAEEPTSARRLQAVSRHQAFTVL